MDLMLLQDGRDVLAIAFDRAVVREVLPLTLQEVLAARLPVEHLVSQTGVELLWVGLCGWAGEK